MSQLDRHDTYPLLTTSDVRPLSYAAVHKQCRTLYAGQPCRRCGAAGKIEVALRPDTPDERLLISVTLRWLYSLDPADYEPLCKSCHVRQDSDLYACPHDRPVGDGGRCQACYVAQYTRYAVRVWADPVTREKLKARHKAYASTPEAKARRNARLRAQRAAARTAGVAR